LGAFFSTMLKIIRAKTEHLQELAPLFDAYRVFYKQESDVGSSLHFLEKRFAKRQSEVFIAYLDGKAVGITQLYTTFSSVSLKPVYILNDLYVKRSQRKIGIGEALLNRAKAFCVENGHKGVALETARDNPAQKLYERLGWQKDAQSFHYFWAAD